MRINDYELMNPLGSDAGDRMKALGQARPLALERLVRALEDFVGGDTGLACKVVETAEVEIYLVPPRFVLVHVPDAAALVRVNHASELIDLVEIVEDYGGYDEARQWDEIRDLALAAV